MQFTCDRCSGDYEVHPSNTVARLYLKDIRCNHLEALCSHCGAREVIFLGPRQMTSVIRDDQVAPTVEVEATAHLRVRAEKAWAAAEDRQPAEPQNGPASSGPSGVPDRGGDVLQQYELSQRHEALLSSFGETLENIPEDLLWDAFGSEHDRRHPDRWVD